MGRTRAATAKGSIRSIANNFNSIPPGRYDSDRMKFYLKRLREIKGVSEQKLIVDLLLTGFEYDPDIADVREKIRGEWQLSKAGSPEEDLL